jgi:hypothetical protein
MVTGREDGEPVVFLHGFASSSEAQWTLSGLNKNAWRIAPGYPGLFIVRN